MKMHYGFGVDDQDGDCLPISSLCREGKGEAHETISGGSPYLIIHTAAVGGVIHPQQVQQAVQHENPDLLPGVVAEGAP